MNPIATTRNPLMQMLMMCKGKSAEQVVNSIIQQNPAMQQTWNQAQSIAAGMNGRDLEQRVRNMAKEKGIDIDELSHLL